MSSADWVQSELNARARYGRKAKPAHTLTPFNRTAVELLVHAMNTGPWNLNVNWPKVDWAWGRGVRFALYTPGLATWDFDRLTRLVLAAHEACVRVEIAPHSFRYLAIIMSPRQPEGGVGERHPTLEQAIERFRGAP